jgi:hypothetical protein
MDNICTTYLIADDISMTFDEEIKFKFLGNYILSLQVNDVNIALLVPRFKRLAIAFVKPEYENKYINDVDVIFICGDRIIYRKSFDLVTKAYMEIDKFLDKQKM